MAFLTGTPEQGHNLLEPDWNKTGSNKNPSLIIEDRFQVEISKSKLESSQEFADRRNQPKVQFLYFETVAEISKQWQNIGISKCRFQDFKSGET